MPRLADTRPDTIFAMLVSTLPAAVRPLQSLGKPTARTVGS